MTIFRSYCIVKNTTFCEKNILYCIAQIAVKSYNKAMIVVENNQKNMLGGIKMKKVFKKQRQQ